MSPEFPQVQRRPTPARAYGDGRTFRPEDLVCDLTCSSRCRRAGGVGYKSLFIHAVETPS